MGDKVTITTITSGHGAVDTLNENFSTLANAFDNTLSRDGDIPNSMGADLDMDSNRILNLPPPVTSTEPARKSDIDSIVAAGLPGYAGNAGKYLKTDGATADWATLGDGLENISGLTPSDGNFIVGDGTSWVAESGPVVRASLGVPDGSEVNAVTITPGTDANVTLTSVQNAADVLVLATGAWTQGRGLIYDDVDRQFTFINNGTYSAIVTTSGTTPTTVTVTPGESLLITVRAGVGASIIGAPISGTFAPALTFGGLSTGMTYSTSSGSYTKTPVGGGLSRVFVQGYMILTNKGIATGPVQASIPFTVYSQLGGHPVAQLWLRNVTYTGQFMGHGPGGVAGIRIEQLTEAGVHTQLTDANFSNTSDVIFSMTYLTQG